MISIAQCMIIKDQSSFLSNDIFAAMKILSGSAFKLYMFLLMYPEQKFKYERLLFVESCGNNKTSANRAFTELVELGFLKEQAFQNYIFYNRGAK